MSGSVTRIRPHLAAGVVVVGASLIAFNPATPTIAADIQERAVRLTGSAAADIADLTTNASTAVAAAGVPGPIAEWINVVTGTVTNLQQLGGEITADPLPILSQVISNQLGFANAAGGDLQAMWTGLQPFLQQLPQDIQTLFGSFATGDFSSAVNNFNTDILLGLLPVANPLQELLGIPGEMAQNFANVVQQLPNIGLTLLLAPLGPTFGTSQAIADSVQSVVDAWGAGQPVQALLDAVNLPAIATNAFINGYQSSFDIGYDGILSSGESAFGGGITNDLLVGIPQIVASTLADGGTTATLAGDLSELGATLFGGLSATLNPGMFAAAFDPIAAANVGSMLATDLATNFSAIALNLLTMF